MLANYSPSPNCETINDPLKNISQIVQSPYRSPVNFLDDLVYRLIAYTRQSNKPSLNLSISLFGRSCLSIADVILSNRADYHLSYSSALSAPLRLILLRIPLCSLCLCG